MPNASRFLLIVAIVLTSSVACRRGGGDFQFAPPRHRLFADLKAPPMNLPRPVTAIPDPNGAPTDLGPSDILVLRQGRLFTGSASASGQVSLGDGRLEFTAANQPPVEVQYRLPKELGPPPQYKGNAELSVHEASNPGGPDKQLLLRTGNAVLFAAVMKKSSEPIQIDIAPGLSIGQIAVDVNAKNTLAPVRVEARESAGPVTVIPVGQVTRLRTAGVVLDVFVSASYRAMQIPKEQHEGGYMLQGWAVRSNQP